jgi:hypothetical protein
VLLLLSLGWAVEAEVVRVEGPQFFVTLGADDLVLPGDTVEVFRVVEVANPSGGAPLSDRFSLGTASIIEVGATLTLVQGSPKTSKSLRVGDIVVAPDNEPPPPEPEPVVLLEASPETATTDGESVLGPDRLAFEQAFRQASATEDLAVRSRIWTAFVDQFPDSSLVSVVRTELKALEALQEVEVVTTTAPDAPVEDFILKMRASSPTEARAGEPVVVSVTVPELNRVTASRIYFRRMDEQTWREAPLDRYGDTSLRGAIPGEAVQAPGIEWYVALQDYEHGEFNAGSPANAKSVRVQATPEPEGVEDRSTVSLRYEFVDFYYLSGADRWHQAEGDFIYRIDRSVLYSVGMGGGYYQGVSGPPSLIAELEGAALDEVLTEVGYKYAYGQVELRLAPLFAIQGRAVMGVQLDGFSIGGEGRVRLGPDEGTNLLLGGGFVPGIGQEFELALDFEAVPRVPMLAAVNVTNQPGLDLQELGVRLVYEARFAVNDQFELGGRLGYQLRNINHSGPAFGVTSVFSW